MSMLIPELEAAALMGVKLTYLKDMRSRGTGPSCVKYPRGGWQYDPESIAEWMAAQTHGNSKAKQHLDQLLKEKEL
jgi:hypothetical protein